MKIISKERFRELICQDLLHQDLTSGKIHPAYMDFVDLTPYVDFLCDKINAEILKEN